jgi:NitT/TauT family transport system permease protein
MTANRSRPIVEKILLPLVPLISACAIAELAVRRQWVPAYLVPAPSQVLKVFATDHDLWKATGETALASVVGFVLSALVGLLIAIALSSSRWVQRMFYPYAVLFQTVPIIAIAPMLVIWVGYGLPTVIVSAFIVSVFPVIANSINGLLSTDPALVDLFRLYGASRPAALLKLRLPFALPAILTGLRVAGGLAVIGAIVGEFITGGGLGGIIDASRTQQRIARVFAVLMIASGLGIALFGIVNFISRRLLRNWHASEKVTE